MGGREKYGTERGDESTVTTEAETGAVESVSMYTTSEFELWVPSACCLAWQLCKAQSGCKNKRDHQYNNNGMILSSENAFKNHDIKVATCSYRLVEGPLHRK